MKVGEHWAYQRWDYSPMEEVAISKLGKKKIEARFLSRGDGERVKSISRDQLLCLWRDRGKFEERVEQRERLAEQPGPDLDEEWNGAETILHAAKVIDVFDLHPLGMARISSVSAAAKLFGVPEKRVTSGPAAIVDGDYAEVPWSTVEDLVRTFAKARPETVVKSIEADRAYWKSEAEDRYNDRPYGSHDDYMAEEMARFERLFGEANDQAMKWCGVRRVALVQQVKALKERESRLRWLVGQARDELARKPTQKAQALVAAMDDALAVRR